MALPIAADEEAVRVRFCGVPGVNVSVAGLELTPAGSPLRVTVTAPVNPFAGTALTLTCWPVLPATSATVAGAAVSEKSGGGAVVVWDTVPQETRVKHSNRQAADAISPNPASCLGVELPIGSLSEEPVVRNGYDS